MRDVIVCKFGGTSLASGERFARVRDIIVSDSRRKYIVVSAPGKVSKDGVKATDLLISAYAAEQGAGIDALNRVKEIFAGIMSYLGIDNVPLDSLDSAVRVSRDMSVSRGEYLSAIILSKLIGYDFCDAGEIFTFVSGVLDCDKTLSNVSLLSKRAVIPGFYGINELGDICTFPRGGSDISGAYIAEGVDACLYENWTDVDGFYTADPSVVAGAFVIPSMTYDQARVLSRLGSGVIHWEAIAPAERREIPIVIKNTFRPERAGTTISKYSRFSSPCIAISKIGIGMSKISVIGGKGECVLCSEKELQETAQHIHDSYYK